MSIDKKTCSKCKILKPLSDFYKRSDSEKHIRNVVINTAKNIDKPILKKGVKHVIIIIQNIATSDVNTSKCGGN